MWVLAVGGGRQFPSWETHKYPRICFHPFAKANCVQEKYESSLGLGGRHPLQGEQYWHWLLLGQGSLLQTLGLASEEVTRYPQPLKAKAVDKTRS